MLENSRSSDIEGLFFFLIAWIFLRSLTPEFVVHRAGELSAAELENLMTIVANPRQFKIPDWLMDRQKEYKNGRYSQVVSNALDMKLRDALERLKKMRSIFGTL